MAVCYPERYGFEKRLLGLLGIETKDVRHATITFGINCLPTITIEKVLDTSVILKMTEEEIKEKSVYFKEKYNFIKGDIENNGKN